jgi:uncharacterized iron-regulated membrane protein
MDLLLALPVAAIICSMALLLYVSAVYVWLRREQSWKSVWLPQMVRFLDSRTALPILLFSTIITAFAGVHIESICFISTLVCINQTTLARLL